MKISLLNGSRPLLFVVKNFSFLLFLLVAIGPVSAQVNRTPIAAVDTINVVKNIPATGNVLTNDTDPDGDGLTASFVTATPNGTEVLYADGSITYTPNDDFTGLDSLVYQTCDNGNPSLCDTALAYFNVNPLVPVITSVSVPANGYYKSGDNLNFAIDFSENVIVDTDDGIPSLGLMIGSVIRQATYISGSGSDILNFVYTVQNGDMDMDGIAVEAALALNGATITNSISDNAILDLNNIGDTDNIFVNTAIPTLELSTSAVSPVKQPFTLSITFSEPVTGFNSADIVITNAAISNLQTTDNITYSALVTPIEDGAISLNVPANKVVNIGGNGNAISNTLNLTYDGTAPAAPVVVTVPDGEIIPVNTAVISGTAEANALITVYIDDVAVSDAVSVNPGGNWTYTSNALADGVHTVKATAKDAAGNVSQGSNANSFTVKTSPDIGTDGTLNALTTTYGMASSAAQFTLSGTNMTVGILVTPPPGFEASTDNNSFSNTVTVGASGTISGTIYIRLKNTAAAGSYSGNIILSSAGATTINLATASSTVNKAPLTITADDKEKFAGTANPELTASYSGFVNNESSIVLTTPPTITTTATLVSPVGDYPITVSGAVGANYIISYAAGSLKIKPGAPTRIDLSEVMVYENSPAGTNAGTLSSTSEDLSATFTYTLVAGTGDADNALFAINDNKLNISTSLNYENQSVYRVRIRSTNQNDLWIEKELSINLSDVNEAPTLATIANQAICYSTNVQVVALTGVSAGPESGQATTLNVSSDNVSLFESLSISGSDATGSISYRVNNNVTGTATVTVTVKDDGGTANGGTDIYSQTFVITVNALPTVAISSNQGSTISKGENIQLTATGADTYLWTADGSILNGLNNDFIVVRPMETTAYTVTGTNASGCTQTQSFTLTVLDDFAKIKANNILTPNNDGYNDKWVIDNIDVYPNNEVKVFDKAGRIVFDKRAYDNTWDGTMNGAPLAEDTYYYIIDFGTGKQKFKGYITLVREN